MKQFPSRMRAGLRPDARGGRLTLCLLAGLLPVAVGSVAAPGDFSFGWDDGRCRLEAEDARVADILADVSETTGVPIQYDKDDAATVTLSIEDMDLEQVIRAVGENVILTYAVDPDSPDGYRVQSVKVEASADEQTRALVERQKVIASSAPIPATGHVKYSGIGASIRYSDDKEGILLSPLTKDSPIVKSGIAPTDVILAVNGQPVSSYGDISDMTKVIRGPEGTPVTFTVRRPDGKVANISVTRQVVEFTRPASRRRR